MAAIEATGLVKTFRTRKNTVKALDGIDLEVPEGSVLGLLGPNGAGKTTAVRVLTTLMAPDAGTARVLGHDVVTEADTVRALVGLSGQYAAVDELLTGRENLWMFGRLLPVEQPAGETTGRGIARHLRPHRRRRPDPEDVLRGYATAGSTWRVR